MNGSVLKINDSPADAGLFVWCAQQDSNLQPSDYESAALTIELWALVSSTRFFRFFLGTFVFTIHLNERRRRNDFTRVELIRHKLRITDG